MNTATQEESNSRLPSAPKPNRDKRIDEIFELIKSGTTTCVVVTGIASNSEGQRRGLSVDLKGLRGFLPGSEMPRNLSDEELLGQTIEVKVLEFQPKRANRLIVSLKAAGQSARKQLISTLQIGSEISGLVVSVVDFGYFVNIGAMDALLHMSQTPLEDGKPKVFAKGETVCARIKSIDPASGKVGLTMRRPRGSDERSQGRARQGRILSPDSPTVTPTPVKGPRVYSTAKVSAVPTGKSRKLRATKKSPFTRQFSSFADLGVWYKTRNSDAIDG
jgi:ribosomal protein S1